MGLAIHFRWGFDLHVVFPNFYLAIWNTTEDYDE